MAKNELTLEEQTVFNLITAHKGKINAVKSVEVERYSRLKGSVVRTIINSLRTKGYPVCSDCNGYYLAENESEIQQTIAHLQSRKAGIDNAINGLMSANLNAEVN